MRDFRHLSPREFLKLHTSFDAATLIERTETILIQSARRICAIGEQRVNASTVCSPSFSAAGRAYQRRVTAAALHVGEQIPHR